MVSKEDVGCLVKCVARYAAKLEKLGCVGNGKLERVDGRDVRGQGFFGLVVWENGKSILVNVHFLEVVLTEGRAPERVLVRRLREKALLSQKQLDTKAGQPLAACAGFERRSMPLSELERQRLVVYLTVLLDCQPRNYQEAMKTFRLQHRLSIRTAAQMANISRCAWFDMEEGLHKRFPHPKVRTRVEALLSRIEQAGSAEVVVVGAVCQPEVAKAFQDAVHSQMWAAT